MTDNQLITKFGGLQCMVVKKAGGYTVWSADAKGDEVKLVSNGELQGSVTISRNMDYQTYVKSVEPRKDF
jgi:hypothetical protein